MGGKLFVIEGTDGSGKQTQYTRLSERLKNEGYNIKSISFPRYNSPSSSLVKMYLAGEFSDNPNEVSPYIASTFYTADRYAAYKQEFEEFYRKGGIVILDRYTSSNMVHQAGKIKDAEERDKYLDWLMAYEFGLFGLPVPDKTFLLDMPPEYVQKLMKDRQNKFSGTGRKDIHERYNQHLKDSYLNALAIADKYDWYTVRCVRDGKVRSIDDIHEEIYSELIKYLPKKGRKIYV